jgi:hypothetical protein
MSRTFSGNGLGRSYADLMRDQHWAAGDGGGGLVRALALALALIMAFAASMPAGWPYQVDLVAWMALVAFLAVLQLLWRRLEERASSLQFFRLMLGQRRRRNRGMMPWSPNLAARLTRGPNPLMALDPRPSAGEATFDPGDRGDPPRPTLGSPSCPPFSRLCWSPPLPA